MLSEAGLTYETALALAQSSIVHSLAVSASRPLIVEVEIEGQCVQMAGEAHSIMVTYKEPGQMLSWKHVRLNKNQVHPYQVAKLTLIAVKGAGSCLFGYKPSD